MRSVGHYFYNDVLACFNKKLNTVCTLDDLMVFKSEMYTRLNYCSFESEVSLWKQVTSAFISAIDSRVPKHKSRMTIALEIINEDNLSELAKLMETVNPMDRRDYAFSPMFDTPDPQKVAKGILAHSNKGRDMFRDILAYHYRNLEVINYNEHKYYEAEMKNVKKIVDILKKKRLKTIDKYSVRLIIQQLENLLNHN